MKCFKSGCATTVQVLLLLLLTATVLHGQEQCPPSGFDSMTEDTFDLERFIGFTWYSLAQKEVSFQPASQFYCVTATYSELNTGTSFWCGLFGCDDPANFDVFNFGRVGSTSGVPNTIRFVASQPENSGSPAKAQIGGTIVPLAFRSDTDSNYWVVAAGKFADLDGVDTTDETGNTGDEYDYAIIIAGEPDEVVDPNDDGTGGGCTPGFGFWLFSYTPTPPAGTADAMKTIAADLGLGTAALLDVVQSVDECNYGRPGFVTRVIGQVVGTADFALNFLTNLFF